MIRLNRLNGTELIVNSDLICYMEEAPDTVLTLVTGMKVIVSQPCEAVVGMVMAHRAEVLRSAMQVRDEVK